MLCHWMGSAQVLASCTCSSWLDPQVSYAYIYARMHSYIYVCSRYACGYVTTIERERARGETCASTTSHRMCLHASRSLFLAWKRIARHAFVHLCLVRIHVRKFIGLVGCWLCSLVGLVRILSENSWSGSFSRNPTDGCFAVFAFRLDTFTYEQNVVAFV